MKKALAYVTAGIVLGVAIMLIPPLMVFPAYYQTLGTSNPLVPTAFLRGTDDCAGTYGSKAEQAPAQGGVPALGGGITFPSSLLYVWLIFAVGLVSALGVYGLFKRRLMG